MPTFHADGFRPVVAESAAEAARIFANRQARRDYGRAGVHLALRLDSWTQNGRSHAFQVFIGKALPREASGTVQGRNVWLHVTRTH